MTAQKFYAFAVLVLVMIPAGLKSQHFYTKVNFGYSAPLGQQSLNEFSDLAADGIENYVQQKGFSFGQGFQSGFGLGLKWNEHFAAELNFSNLISSKLESEITTSDEYFYRSLQANMVSAIPSLVLMAPINGKTWGYYSRMGLIIGLATKLNFETKSIDDMGDVYEQSFKMNGSIPVGFNGVLGIKWSVLKVDFFMELDYKTLTYAPTQRSLLESTKNGSSNFHEQSIRDRETVYVQELDLMPIAPVNEQEPMEVLISYYAFSSIGLNFGISVHLF